MKIFCAGKNTASFRNEYGTYFDVDLEDYEQLPKGLDEMLLFNAGTGLTAKTSDRCEKMLYWGAELIGESELLEGALCSGLRNRLLSYADIENVAGTFRFWLSREPSGKRLFLDSGAFSVFTRGAQINLDEYISYIKEHEKNLFCYAGLDVIDDPVGTRKNFEIMKKAGLNPVPTFHVGSSLSELELYCASCSYIALGGMVPLSRQKETLQGFLDSCFSIVKKNWPIKVHAFGMTAQWLLERYPFYSCDSTTAFVGGGMGRVLSFDKGRLTSSVWQDQGKQGKTAGLVDNLNGDGSKHLARRIHNVRVMVRFEKHITDLWKKRGIEWQE